MTLLLRMKLRSGRLVSFPIFFAGRCGVKEYDSVMVGSPFDYERKTMIICPDDSPAPDSPQMGQRKRSVWQLPRFFHPSTSTKMSYHEDLLSKSGKPVWELKDNYCLLQSVGRGQEFVIEGNGEVENWAKELIERQYPKFHDSKPVKAE